MTRAKLRGASPMRWPGVGRHGVPMPTPPSEVQTRPTAAVLTLTVRQCGSTIEGTVEFDGAEVTFDGWSGLGSAVQSCLDRLEIDLTARQP